jgi:hypothetical protein
MDAERGLRWHSLGLEERPEGVEVRWKSFATLPGAPVKLSSSSQGGMLDNVICD